MVSQKVKILRKRIFDQSLDDYHHYLNKLSLERLKQEVEKLIDIQWKHDIDLNFLINIVKLELRKRDI